MLDDATLTRSEIGWNLLSACALFILFGLHSQGELALLGLAAIGLKVSLGIWIWLRATQSIPRVPYLLAMLYVCQVLLLMYALIMLFIITPYILVQLFWEKFGLLGVINLALAVLGIVAIGMSTKGGRSYVGETTARIYRGIKSTFAVSGKHGGTGDGTAAHSKSAMLESTEVTE